MTRVEKRGYREEEDMGGEKEMRNRDGDRREEDERDNESKVGEGQERRGLVIARGEG